MWTELTTPSLSPLICLISVLVLSAVSAYIATECQNKWIEVLEEEIRQLKEELDGKVDKK